MPRITRGPAARLVHDAPHLADRGIEADEDRLADQEWPMLSSRTSGSPRPGATSA
jgi:hypothetical protein